MKKLYSLFLSALMIFSAFPAEVFAQAKPMLAVDSRQPVMSDYFATLNYVDKVEAEIKSQILQKKVQMFNLMQDVEKALAENNPKNFHDSVNKLNATLLTDIYDPVMDNRYFAVTTLAEHIKKGLISPSDTQEAFDAFETLLTENLKCSSFFCEVLGMSAMSLALSRDTDNILLLPVEMERTKLTDRQRRIFLLNKLISNDYGSLEANRTMGIYLLRAAAYLDGIKSVKNMTDQLIELGKESWGRRHLNKYNLKSYELQKDAMKVLAEMGPAAKPYLLDYAINRRSLASQVHAEIEMAYLPLTAQEQQRNKRALEIFYCHRDFHLSSQKDMELKQEIAYAYGRGRKMEFVTTEGSSQCLVTYPTQPNPRIVAKEWTEVGMQEVIFLGATMGVGPLLSGMKNGVRVLKHLKTLRTYAASRRHQTLTQFFRRGGMKALPKFATPTEATVAAAGTFVTAPARIPEQINIVKMAPVESVAKTQALQQKPTLSAAKKQMEELAKYPQKNPRTDRYPSGLRDEQWVTREWLDYYEHGYFKPRNQIEAIEGMTPKKMNNVIEHLFYMNMETAERVILDPIRRTGKLPLFMYDDKLIPGTKRLMSGYYKTKFNDNVARLVRYAAEEGAVYKHNVALTDIAISMKDYTFAQGFIYPNNFMMSRGLSKNWKHIVDEITTKGVNANRGKIDHYWRKNVSFGEGKTVTLKEYFSQTRETAFFKKKAPDFYLNSPKWVAWENERRNLAAADYVHNLGMKNAETLTDKVQNFFILGKRKNYLSLDEYSNIMYHQYRSNPKVQRILGKWGDNVDPNSLFFREICHEGRACQMAITDGGLPRIRPGYDGTRLRTRFAMSTERDVKAIVFDANSGAAKPVKLKELVSLSDLRPADFDLIEAGTMLADRLDDTFDLLSVQKAQRALHKLPDLKATIYPKPRLPHLTELPESLTGGGMNAYLSLFKKDFYPVRTIYRVRFDGLKPYLKPEHYVRKEVPALAGTVHRQDLTFLDQVQHLIHK